MTIPDANLRATEWDLVVVGRGYSGLCNVVTQLHQGKLPERTLLVGSVDPWRRYVSHGMGQYPSLLTLPGFEKNAQPLESPPDNFLSSRRFAQQNRLQLWKLLHNNNISEINCLVDKPFTFVNDRWLVQLTREGRSVSLRSKRVDVCTGPGPSRVFSPGAERIYGAWSAGIRDSFDPSLLQELMDGVGNRAIVAESFMTDKNSPGAVIVVGEGPLAANAVEHALRLGASHVYWVGRPVEMLDSFPPSERYDQLIVDGKQTRNEKPRVQSEINARRIPNFNIIFPHLKPINKNLTILLGQVSRVQIPAITVIASGHFDLVTLTNTSVHEYATGTALPLTVDKLVISASSQNNELERLSAAYLLRSVPKALFGKGLQSITRDGILVGLQVPDGSLRVLGAPSRNPFLISNVSPSTEDDAYKKWHDSLCAQARMTGYAMGITVGAATIAMANNYYNSTAPDYCAQTTLADSHPVISLRRDCVGPFRQNDLLSTQYFEHPRTA